MTTNAEELTLMLMTKTSGDVHAVYMLGRQVVIQAACLTTAICAGIIRSSETGPKSTKTARARASPQQLVDPPSSWFRAILLAIMIGATCMSLYQATHIWDANLLPGRLLVQHLND